MEDLPGKKYALLPTSHWLLKSAEEDTEILSEQEMILTKEELNLLDEAKKGRKKTVKRRSAKRRSKRRAKRKKKKSGKKDACYYKVRSRYSVWPSAYASGALVKCRKVGAKNWGNSTKEGQFSQELLEEAVVEDLVDRIIDLIQEKKRRKRKKKRGGKRKLTQKASSESNLGDWFKRKGAKGSKGGWVDCNTCRKDKKTGRKKCKPCGRSKGEKRSRYPSCRPTPGACSQKGKGKKWGKKSKKK